MDKFFLAAAFIIFFTLSAFPQWTIKGPLPQPNTLTDVKFISADIAWAVGFGGALIKSTDGGISWEVRTGNSHYFNSIFFTDLNYGFICGNSGILLKTTDSGDTWVEKISGTNETLFDISFFDKYNGIISTSNGKILKTSDGGESWTSHILENYYVIFSVAYLDSRTAFAAGYHDDDVTSYKIFKSTDGGLSWNEKLFGNHKFVSGIFFLDSLNGWVSTSLGLLKTTDGGEFWIGLGTSHAFHDVWFHDQNNGIAAGSSGEIIKTSDGGLTWSVINSMTTQSLLSLSFYGLEGLAVGWYGTILRSSDGGNSWNIITRTCSDNLRGVHLINAKKGFVVGDAGTVLVTVDAAENWERVPINSSKDLRDVFFIDDSTGWIAGLDNTIFKTTDGGSTWIDISVGINCNLYSISFSDRNNGVAVGSVAIRTSNGGQNWVISNTPGSGILNKVQHVKGTILYTMGNGGRILKSGNNGITWSQQQSSIFEDIYSFHFSDENNGWASANWQNLISTTNGGQTWVKRVTGFTASGIFFTDRNNGTMIIKWQPYIYRTTNAGYDWSYQQNFNFQNDLYDIYMIKGSTGVIVGEGGLILKTDTSGVLTDIHSQKSSHPSEFSLHQNYPNPFNPLTTINYSLPEEVNVQLIIYDALGRKIKILTDEIKPAGNYSYSFKPNGLPSGIYLYQLKADKFVQTRKMIILK